MAKDREAWRHVLLALDLLHHYQWNIALMKKVRNEMKLAIDRMAERLAAGSDENRAEDLRFFLSLLNDVESGIQNGNLLVMRSVEQSLIRHLLKTDPHNRQLQQLRSTKRDGELDMVYVGSAGWAFEKSISRPNGSEESGMEQSISPARMRLVKEAIQAREQYLK